MVWDISKPTLVALDFNKILSSVNVKEPKEPTVPFSVKYEKRILIICDFESYTGSVELNIADIQGKLIYSVTQPILTGSSRIEIPVALPAGTYILLLKDGKQEYSQKFIVTR